MRRTITKDTEPTRDQAAEAQLEEVARRQYDDAFWGGVTDGRAGQRHRQASAEATSDEHAKAYHAGLRLGIGGYSTVDTFTSEPDED